MAGRLLIENIENAEFDAHTLRFFQAHGMRNLHVGRGQCRRSAHVPTSVYKHRNTLHRVDARRKRCTARQDVEDTHVCSPDRSFIESISSIPLENVWPVRGEKAARIEMSF